MVTTKAPQHPSNAADNVAGSVKSPLNTSTPLSESLFAAGELGFRVRARTPYCSGNCSSSLTTEPPVSLPSECVSTKYEIRPTLVAGGARYQYLFRHCNFEYKFPRSSTSQLLTVSMSTINVQHSPQIFGMYRLQVLVRLVIFLQLTNLYALRNVAVDKDNNTIEAK